MSPPLEALGQALQVPDWVTPEWVLAGSAMVGVLITVLLAVSLARANRRGTFGSMR